MQIAVNQFNITDALPTTASGIVDAFNADPAFSDAGFAQVGKRVTTSKYYVVFTAPPGTVQQ